MAWTCTAANGTGSLVFTDDVTADRSSRMNSEVYRVMLYAQIKPDAAKHLKGEKKLFHFPNSYVSNSISFAVKYQVPIS